MTTALVPLCAMLAPCSTLSRTLRADFVGAASGIPDNVCARRSAHQQVGTKGWPHRSNKGMTAKKEEQAERFSLTSKVPYNGWGEGLQTLDNYSMLEAPSPQPSPQKGRGGTPSLLRRSASTSA